MKKKEKLVLIVLRVIAVLIGIFGALCLIPALPFGLVVLAVAAFIWYQTVRIKKGYIKKAQDKADAQARAAEKERLEAEKKAEAERAAAEAAKKKEEEHKKMTASREATKNNPAEYERLHNMCADIVKEYKELLKQYKNLDPADECDALSMASILKECYRKMDVLATTIIWHDCYNDLEPYDEMEKIEKRAKSLINAYARENNGDYLDLSQFSDSLWFISDYIYDKEEKLNKE